MTSEHGRSGEQRAPRPFPAREAADEGGTQLPSARASAENRLPAARTGDDTAPPVFAGERADPRRHLDRLRSLQRAATRPGGVRGVLRWVAAHVGGSSALLDASGRSLGAWPERRTDALAAVAGHVERVGAGEAHSAVVDHDAHQATAVLPTGRARPTPVLVVTAAKEALLPEKDLLAEAARTLGLCWRAEQAERAEQRLERADTQIREAVLHLLMLGDRGGAGRVATTLRPRLPDPLRVYVAECKGQARDALAAHCAEVCAGRAWIVRCPVYPRHVIALAPAGGSVQPPPARDPAAETEDDPIESRFRQFAGRRPEVRIGASEVVPLRDTATGYEQAFHALSVARGGAQRYARFSAKDELAGLLAGAGRTWARHALAPLLDHMPHRPQDPDADELRVTLESWLNFATRAARQLKIHRNTLSSRLKHVERLLDRDLRRLGTQAELHLALRILGQPRPRAAVPQQHSLAALLDTTPVRLWAEHQLSPLLTDDARPLLDSLRAWLAHDAHAELAASALGISVPGMRKRLLRVEGMLRRSLLHGPSARYELWFALRVLDR